MHAHYYTLIVIGATFLILFFVTSAFHTLMPQECVWGGEGGGLRFSYIYVGWDHFWGFKILNFNIFGGFQKYHYFWGYEDFVDIS